MPNTDTNSRKSATRNLETESISVLADRKRHMLNGRGLSLCLLTVCNYFPLSFS